ncbi:MAG: transcription termination factor Rho [Puniceicoccales bacterium]|jgi:transcription termination factor Rho|nr:transcription termination factor Rho [Puniceicoccales bacterium]
MDEQNFEAENSIPEKFSVDFDDVGEEKSQGRRRYENYDEEWTPQYSNTPAEGDFPRKAGDGRRKFNGNGRGFSSQLDESSPNQQNRHQQRQSNYSRYGNRPQSGDNRPRRDGEKISQSNRRPQNNNQNRQKFAKTVKIGQLSSGFIKGMECLSSPEKLAEFANENIDFNATPFDFNDAYENRAMLSARDIVDDSESSSQADFDKSSHRILELLLLKKFAEKTPIVARGVLETIEGGDGLLVYANDNYRIRPQSAFIAKFLIKKYGLRRGQDILAYLHPPAQNSTCPFVMEISSAMEMNPAEIPNLPKFKDLTPFYPTERLFLECTEDVKWDNISMRIVDILTPIGLGQRGLIVAPPRTGKTILLQCIANAISKNRPDAKLIILLIDERPEEVTDFSRQVKNAEIISSTFDESSDNHVHAADMVIDKARRQVEAGKHVVILLDSITRLARAHNTEQPSSGKLLSGGVDANALQAPKKFFGAARNIEGGGSLTILATALVETGSRMDEVIFEEFKGTGNMELHLDRALVDKRMFPALNIEKSGTRKEELLYHPDEMEKVYALRRAMKGVPSVDAMEMLIQRIRKTKTNTEFLLNVNR